jgi:N-acetylneuraminic acid mutarotase
MQAQPGPNVPYTAAMVRTEARTTWYLAAALAVLCGGCGDDGNGGGDPDGGDGPAGGRWETLSPIESGPVQETAVVELGGKIYVVGGFHGTRGIVSDFLVYDPAEDAWDTAAPLPAPVHHANAAAANGKIYVVGALSGAGFQAVGVTWEYDPDLDQWAEKTPMPGGTERGSSAVGVVDGVIYLAGGFRGGSVADVSSYDPIGDQHDASSWPDLPEALDHLVGAAVGGSFYAIGGRRGGIAGVKERVDMLLPAGGGGGGGGWVPRAPIPTARAGMAVGVVGGRIVVVGGEGNTAASSGVFAEAEIYDPAADEWSALPSMVVPRHGMGAAGLGDALYVPGGADVQAFGAVATNERLVIE